ncbi:MAG: GNAT family N-acetyltransferase [Verrucomicrobiota bacterium]|jgi:predicted acetyltransferase
MKSSPHSAKVELIEPCEVLEAAYRSFVNEFLERKEPLIPAVLEYDARDFGALIRRFREDAAGIGLPEGYVPASCFWLIDQHKTLVGVAHLRHSLNAALSYEGGHIGYGIRPTQRNKGYGKIMLKLLLERAEARGITKILLTCDKANVASGRVIQSNGGRLDSEVPRKDGKGIT